MTEEFNDEMKRRIRQRIDETLDRLGNPAYDKRDLKWNLNQMIELLSAGSYRAYYNNSWIFEDVLPQLDGPQGKKVDMRLAATKSPV